MAAVVSCVELPEASSISLSARPASVALLRSPVTGTKLCTTEDISLMAVGRPVSLSDIFVIDASASSALYPRDCMTFG